MSHPSWDTTISASQMKVILCNPDHPEFTWTLARILSRVSFAEVFQDYLSRKIFLKNFKKSRNLMKSDLLGAGRLPFWEWAYQRLKV